MLALLYEDDGLNGVVPQLHRAEARVAELEGERDEAVRDYQDAKTYYEGELDSLVARVAELEAALAEIGTSDELAIVSVRQLRIIARAALTGEAA